MFDLNGQLSVLGTFTEVPISCFTDHLSDFLCIPVLGDGHSTGCRYRRIARRTRSGSSQRSDSCRSSSCTTAGASHLPLPSSGLGLVIVFFIDIMVVLFGRRSCRWIIFL